MNKAVFFDRDGVAVKNIGSVAPTNVKDLELIPEAITIIKELQKRGYKIIVISNQPDAALGIIDEITKNALVKRFGQLIEENDVSLDGIYYCFHHPRGIVKKYTKECNCKKPKPGLILKAINDHKIDPAKSFIIGDRASDIKAGSLAGIKTVLFDAENSEQDYLLEYNVRPDFTVNKLLEVTEIIKEIL